MIKAFKLVKDEITDAMYLIIGEGSGKQELSKVAKTLQVENDVEATAQTLKRILTDEKLAEKLVDNGRKRVKEFSWDNYVNTILNINDTILKRK